MALTPAQAVASIAVMAAVTFLTRFLPFLLFDRKSNPPKVVLYLGRVLPPAIIMMLVVAERFFYKRKHIMMVRAAEQQLMAQNAQETEAAKA